MVINISDKVYAELKKHLADKKIKIYEFTEKAIMKLIEEENEKSGLL